MKFSNRSPQSERPEPQPTKTNGTQPAADIEFLTETGNKVTLAFKKKPLGMKFSNRSPQGGTDHFPIFVSAVRAGSHAGELGVQIGWQFNKIDGQSADKMNFQAVEAALIECTKRLPS